MKNMKSTKRALIVSVMSLFICFTMLLGTTYAWFTDSVTSAGNIIKTGTLDVSLKYSADLPVAVDGKIEDATQWADASTGAIFYHDNWEPGYTQVRYVKVENEGTLDLKFVLTIVPNVKAAAGEANLADVIDVYIAKEVVAVDRALTGLTRVGTLADLIADPDGAAYGVLYADDTDKAGKTFEAYTIVLKMQETAGNEYQNLSLGGGFSVNLLASQLASESDDLDNTYDENAEYPIVGAGSRTVDGSAAYNVPAVKSNGSGTENAGYMEITKEAIDPDAKEVGIVISEAPLQSNILVTDGHTAETYDVTVTGLKDNNTEPVTVGIYVGEGFDPTTFKLYHTENGTNNEIDCIYNPGDGYVVFESATFSPFTVVYDAESEYVPPVVEVPEGSDKPEGLPVASVVESTQYENVELPWGNYGGWSPTEGLDAQLEAAYTFSCTQTLEEAKASPFAYWYCDFVVVLDKELGENQIFLGGNYGSFGWVGFHNGDLTLEANTEIPLLGSVTSNPWTYVDVVSSVGTFICGVGDVDDALSGATFTVMLRLTNPEDASEYYNVATINYTFE